MIPVLSIGPFLGSSSVPAVTDEGCTFVADAGQFYLPLDGFPTLPLGLPVDEWFVYDTGLPVPFLPYTTFGAVYFAADDDNDGPTVVASPPGKGGPGRHCGVRTVPRNHPAQTNWPVQRSPRYASFAASSLGEVRYRDHARRSCAVVSSS